MRAYFNDFGRCYCIVSKEIHNAFLKDKTTFDFSKESVKDLTFVWRKVYLDLPSSRFSIMPAGFEFRELMSFK